MVITYHQLFISPTANDISHAFENAFKNTTKPCFITVENRIEFINGAFEKKEKK
jgi:hypothetical protein